MSDWVPFQRPELPPWDEIGRYFERARSAGWYSNGGPCVRLLEERLGNYVGEAASCVAVANGTLGLMVALRSATSQTRAADEVIVPSFTYIATVSAILWCGLRPVYVDVAPGHWHLDPDALSAAVEERGDRVAAVLACSTFGTAPPTAVSRAWEAICARRELPLLVDSAAGFGSRDEAGRPLGGQGTAEVFSFHATKPFAVGEGGAVVTSDRRLAGAIARQAAFGLSAERELVDAPGLNAKMSELHAAVALAQLDRLARVLAARRSRAVRMRTVLSEHGYEFQDGLTESACQFVAALAPSGAVRDRALRDAGPAKIQLRAYHTPIHEMGPTAEFRASGELSVTADLAARAVSLPMANDLDDDELDRVCELLAGAVA